MMLARSIWPRILCAATKIPRLRDWLEAAILLAGVGAAAWMLGFAGGPMTLRPMADAAELALTALIALVIPAFAEEALFRAPLPRWGSPRSLLWAASSLALFVAWHPTQVALRLPTAQPVFADPRFLAIAAILGAACTVSRLRSGSLWPAVAMHWAVVVAWKGLTGG